MKAKDVTPEFVQVCIKNLIRNKGVYKLHITGEKAINKIIQDIQKEPGFKRVNGYVINDNGKTALELNFVKPKKFKNLLNIHHESSKK